MNRLTMMVGEVAAIAIGITAGIMLGRSRPPSGGAPASIGGPFELVGQDSHSVTDKTILGVTLWTFGRGLPDG
jgi:hypothetical protein